MVPCGLLTLARQDLFIPQYMSWNFSLGWSLFDQVRPDVVERLAVTFFDDF